MSSSKKHSLIKSILLSEKDNYYDFVEVFRPVIGTLSLKLKPILGFEFDDLVQEKLEDFYINFKKEIEINKEFSVPGNNLYSYIIKNINWHLLDIVKKKKTVNIKSVLEFFESNVDSDYKNSNIFEGLDYIYRYKGRTDVESTTFKNPIIYKDFNSLITEVLLPFLTFRNLISVFQKEIIIYREIENLTFKKISHTICQTENKIKKQYYRAVKMMRLFFVWLFDFSEDIDLKVNYEIDKFYGLNKYYGEEEIRKLKVNNFKYNYTSKVSKSYCFERLKKINFLYGRYRDELLELIKKLIMKKSLKIVTDLDLEIKDFYYERKKESRILTEKFFEEYLFIFRENNEIFQLNSLDILRFAKLFLIINEFPEKITKIMKKNIKKILKDNERTEWEMKKEVVLFLNENPSINKKYHIKISPDDINLSGEELKKMHGDMAMSVKEINIKILEYLKRWGKY